MKKNEQKIKQRIKRLKRIWAILSLGKLYFMAKKFSEVTNHPINYEQAQKLSTEINQTFNHRSTPEVFLNLQKNAADHCGAVYKEYKIGLKDIEAKQMANAQAVDYMMQSFYDSKDASCRLFHGRFDYFIDFTMLLIIYIDEKINIEHFLFGLYKCQEQSLGIDLSQLPRVYYRLICEIEHMYEIAELTVNTQKL